VFLDPDYFKDDATHTGKDFWWGAG
jgi:hypothetical protein